MWALVPVLSAAHMRSRRTGLVREDSRSSRFNRSIDADDAVFIVALQRYIIACAQHGEQVSDLAVAQMVQCARALGMAPDPRLRVLGFSLRGAVVRSVNRDILLAALRVVRLSERGRWVQALYDQCQRSG